MRYKIEYSKAAIRDLDRVWYEVYETSKNLDITRKYLQELMDKIETKTEYPKSGSLLYYEDQFTGYYFVIYKAYIAFYRLENNGVFIDRVLYGKSDYMRHLHISL